MTSTSPVVVVTGGGTGIGRAIAERFAADGAAVVLVGRRHDVLADAAAALGPESLPVMADVSRPNDVDALAATVSERFGRVDVLVNNAGYLLPVTLADQAAGAAALTVMLGVNLVGAYLVSAALNDLLT